MEEYYTQLAPIFAHANRLYIRARARVSYLMLRVCAGVLSASSLRSASLMYKKFLLYICNSLKVYYWHYIYSYICTYIVEFAQSHPMCI